VVERGNRERKVRRANGGRQAVTMEGMREMEKFEAYNEEAT
jgi:hypothetical protein